MSAPGFDPLASVAAVREAGDIVAREADAAAGEYRESLGEAVGALYRAMADVLVVSGNVPPVMGTEYRDRVVGNAIIALTDTGNILARDIGI